MSNISFVLVSGFFSSGSSAVVDLLKEYSNTYECDAEIRLIKDPYGIGHLEETLLDHWELINSSAAIEDFLWMCRICARTNTHFPLSPVGLSYKKKIHPRFMEITNNYISKLTEFTYKTDYYHQKFKKSYLQYVFDRCRMGIEIYSGGRIKIANRKIAPSYFAKPEREDFYRYTQEYFEELFVQYAKTDDEKYRIVLDQAVSPNNCELMNHCFKDAKMIIIDRDPRDMYIDDIINWGVILDDDYISEEAGRRFAIRQQALRCNLVNDDNIKYIRFEDLILKYDQVSQDVASFIGMTESQHINKKKYLKPELSVNNIGIWKQHYDKYKDALDIIGKLLPELCYEGDKE